MSSEDKVWPFSVIPEESWTEQHRSEMNFLRSAHAAGFTAYTFNLGSFGAESESGYKGELIHRGANVHWELVLSKDGERIESKRVTDFAKGADELMTWLLVMS